MAERMQERAFFALVEYFISQIMAIKNVYISKYHAHISFSLALCQFNSQTNCVCCTCLILGAK